MKYQSISKWLWQLIVKCEYYRQECIARLRYDADKLRIAEEKKRLMTDIRNGIKRAPFGSMKFTESETEEIRGLYPDDAGYLHLFFRRSVQSDT